MRGWFSKLREVAKRNPEMHVEDPELGTLDFNDSCWECTIASKSGPIKLCVGGRYEPDPACIESARATARRIDVFVDEVKANLAVAAEHKALKQFADEIAGLKICDVHYVWPKEPKNGMIYFSGPDENKVWHCDIEDGKMYGLVFDS